MRRGRLVLVVALAVAAAAAVAVVVAFAAGSDGESELLPDLDLTAPGELSGRTVGRADDPRFFLGFDSAAGNVGDGPLIIVGSRPNRQQREMTVVQRIESEDGSTRTVPVTAKLLYVHSADHEHWHLLDFMRYELRRANGKLVAPDQKTGFCLGDRYEVGLQLGRRRARADVHPGVRQGPARAAPAPRGHLRRIRRRLRRASRGPELRHHRPSRRALSARAPRQPGTRPAKSSTTRTTPRRCRSSSAGRTGRRARRASPSSAAAPTRRPARSRSGRLKAHGVGRRAMERCAGTQQLP